MLLISLNLHLQIYFIYLFITMFHFENEFKISSILQFNELNMIHASVQFIQLLYYIRIFIQNINYFVQQLVPIQDLLIYCCYFSQFNIIIHISYFNSYTFEKKHLLGIFYSISEYYTYHIPLHISIVIFEIGRYLALLCTL